MDAHRLMDHPAGLGLIRCEISGNTAHATACLIAGSSIELQRFHALSGVLAWLIESLEKELAASGVSSIVIPETAAASTPAAVSEARTSWLDDALTSMGYAWDSSISSYTVTMQSQLLPRRH